MSRWPLLLPAPALVAVIAARALGYCTVCALDLHPDSPASSSTAVGRLNSFCDIISHSPSATVFSRRGLGKFLSLFCGPHNLNNQLANKNCSFDSGASGTSASVTLSPV
ncbi:hypothetical protein FN846DRAFT_715038 [Sphaerosporella brunnea]|uniref:Uncharacterized protein n=1 Tax=Sphaerosporella brunnea TaxID=1250544 RepID=A0A5J5EX10_9PEZI|nr:hypothetical protein FN846DRAFT_715038 [Sphaerosporella brunnea]